MKTLNLGNFYGSFFKELVLQNSEYFPLFTDKGTWKFLQFFQEIQNEAFREQNILELY